MAARTLVDRFPDAVATSVVACAAEAGLPSPASGQHDPVVVAGECHIPPEKTGDGLRLHGHGGHCTARLLPIPSRRTLSRAAMPAKALADWWRGCVRP